jgi:hypothetical protein
MAAISNAIESIGTEAHKGMLVTCLSGILECYGFDQDDLVAVAQRRLQCHVQGESIVEEGTGSSSQGNIHDSIKTSTRSLFSSAFLNQHTMESLDGFMKTFSTNSEDKRMPLPQAPFTAATVSPDKNMTKPKRPLTAYHIYLAIEREFIIQSIPGENADKSADDDKVYLDYVPERYRQTKLSPDWYFGPGKRKRRKHRKQHGKIGFKELTTIISKRWAKLDKTNPDVKRFVQKLAKQGMEDYQREMEEYEKHTASVASTEYTNTGKRAIECVEEDYDVPSKPQKKPRQMQRNVSVLFDNATGEAVDKECPNDITKLCLSTTISPDLNAFQYRPVMKTQKTAQGNTSYCRLVSVDGRILA